MKNKIKYILLKFLIIMGSVIPYTLGFSIVMLPVILGTVYNMKNVGWLLIITTPAAFAICVIAAMIINWEKVFDFEDFPK
jgi:hypothetical protein